MRYIMKNRILKINFSLIIILINTFFLENTYSSSQDTEDLEDSWEIIPHIKEKIDLSPRQLEIAIRDLEVKTAIKSAIQKWNEKKNAPPSYWSYLSWLSSSNTFEMFDSSTVEYKRTDKDGKTLETEFKELSSLNSELDSYLSPNGLYILADGEVQGALRSIISSISTEIEDEAGISILKRAHPLFVENLGLKGRALTRPSYKLVEAPISRMLYLTSLSLEFDHFEVGLLTYVLPKVQALTALTLKGNFGTYHLQELSKMQKILANLDELQLFSTREENDTPYMNVLIQLFKLTPDLKVLGLASSTNLPLDNIGLYIQIGNNLRKLQEIRLLKIAVDREKLKSSLALLRGAYPTTKQLEINLSDNPELMRFIEKALYPVKSVPIASA